MGDDQGQSSGQKIKIWLDAVGKTQKWLAEEYGSTEQYVSNVINDRRPPSKRMAGWIEHTSRDLAQKGKGHVVTVYDLLYGGGLPLGEAVLVTA